MYSIIKTEFKRFPGKNWFVNEHKIVGWRDIYLEANDSVLFFIKNYHNKVGYLYDNFGKGKHVVSFKENIIDVKVVYQIVKITFNK